MRKVAFRDQESVSPKCGKWYFGAKKVLGYFYSVSPKCGKWYFGAKKVLGYLYSVSPKCGKWYFGARKFLATFTVSRQNVESDISGPRKFLATFPVSRQNVESDITGPRKFLATSRLSRQNNPLASSCHSQFSQRVQTRVARLAFFMPTFSDLAHCKVVGSKKITWHFSLKCQQGIFIANQFKICQTWESWHKNANLATLVQTLKWLMCVVIYLTVWKCNGQVQYMQCCSVDA